MENRTMFPLKRFLALAIITWGAGVSAADNAVDSPQSAPMLLAGEIILVPPRSDVSSSESEASKQRDVAREYRKGQTAPATSVIIVPEEEEGILSPRRSNGAAENAARARASRQGDAGTGVASPPIVLPESSAAGTESVSAQRARNNRARATEYRKGEQHTSVAVKGTDGLPVIDCNAADNVAGRIGDDSRSGSVVILIQDRNQIKVRCR